MTEEEQYAQSKKYTLKKVMLARLSDDRMAVFDMYYNLHSVCDIPPNLVQFLDINQREPVRASVRRVSLDINTEDLDI